MLQIELNMYQAVDVYKRQTDPDLLVIRSIGFTACGRDTRHGCIDGCLHGDQRQRQKSG